MDRSNEIAVAARWWADQLRHWMPKPETGDEQINTFYAVAKILANKVTSGEANRFEAWLKNEIAFHLDNCTENDELIISTDYEPDSILTSALDKVGLSGELLPIKTIMHIDVGRVAVQCGYGVKEEVLYQNSINKT